MLGKHLRDHLASDIRQAEIPSLEAKGKFDVVDSEQVQNGGLQVVDMHRIFDR